MSKLQDHVVDMIKYLEAKHGFKREHVKGGTYVVRNDRSQSKSGSPEYLIDMGKYVELIAINELCASEIHSTDRKFVESMIAHTGVKNKGTEDLYIELASESLTLLKALRVQSVTGRKNNIHVISNVCTTIAAICLRIRDLTMGFAHVEDKVIEMNTKLN